jgi:hypothetical protein
MMLEICTVLICRRHHDYIRFLCDALNQRPTSDEHGGPSVEATGHKAASGRLYLFRQSRQTYGDADVAASKRDSADVWPFDLNRL